MNIKNLPKNILFSILLKCDIKTCLNLSCIIHKINQIWNNNHFWKCKYIHDFPKHTQYTFESYKESYIYNYINEYYHLEVDNNVIHPKIKFKNYLKNTGIIDASNFKSIYDQVIHLYQWKDYYIILLRDKCISVLYGINKISNNLNVIYTFTTPPHITINTNYIFLIQSNQILYIDKKLNYHHSNIDNHQIYNQPIIVSSNNIIYTRDLEIDVFNAIVTSINN